MSILVLALVTATMIAGAWWSLYGYLTRFLIPLFLWPDRIPPDAVGEERHLGDDRHTYYFGPSQAARHLKRAFQFLMLAGLSRLAIALTQLVLTSLRDRP